MKRLVFLCCCLLALTSCSSERSLLEPEHQPRELVSSAIVTSAAPVYREKNGAGVLIRFKEIDGKAPTFTDARVVVSPGKHRFLVLVELSKIHPEARSKSVITKIEAELEFKALAEREYKVDAVENAAGVWVWVKDEATGEIVAGDAP